MFPTNRRRVTAIAVAVLALAGGTASTLAARDGGSAPSVTAGTGVSGGSAPATGRGPTPKAEPATNAPAAGDADLPVIVPGRPGEPARTAPADQIDAAAERHNSMDVWFVRMMIPHHTQALQMAELARTRAGATGVRALADRIRASQVPEIQLLRGWLAARHLGLDDPGAGHDHATMPGMQSSTAMRRLADARGPEFDRLFVEMMIAHHQGAITMADDLLRVGIDTTIHQFATSVAVEQGVEIDRMRALAPG